MGGGIGGGGGTLGGWYCVVIRPNKKAPVAHTGGLLACSGLRASDKRRKRRAVRFSAKTFWCRAQLGPVRAGAQRQCDTVSASLVGHLLYQ